MKDNRVSESSLLISRSGIPYDEPDNRRPYQRQLAIYLILASTALERVAFYALVINLVISLKTGDLRWSYDNILTISFIFSGVSYISTLIFAALCDAKLGRAKTIIIGFCLYVVGYVIVILITKGGTRNHLCGASLLRNITANNDIVDERCFGTIMSTLMVIAVGVGAVQANMAVFGAEQIRETDEPSRYFDKYITAINMGAICGILLVSYIQDFQQDPDRYFHGYLFAGISVVISAVLFILGIRFYIHVRPHDTIMTKCIPVVYNAFQTKRRRKHDHDTRYLKRANSVSGNPLFDSTNSRQSEQSDINDKIPSFLDYARARYGGRFIDRIVADVKSLQRVILVFLLLIPYWLIYYQFQTTFLLQGQHMFAPNISSNPSIKMPVIWMSVVDQLAVFIGLLIFNLFARKRLDAYDQTNLLLIKFVMGMILASIAVFTAGTIEAVRQNSCLDEQGQYKLSIFVQLPQYFLMGLSEVFAMVASYEFAYMAAPRSAQSLIMSIRFCSLGVSSFIGEGYVELFGMKRDAFDFDCRHNESVFYMYFFVLGIIQLLVIPIFIACHRKFDILKLNERIFNRRQFM